ncbi:CheD [Pseudodesulfovibrio mercurii]|uniref:Probable chemoreceptor glutamine deamidase CheD n=1 Tax=Pseudodesulfovibrio mercurii TaxID=641491 RepID=F0JD84_9BACT|nr:chemotaxis protein CheD [Pseudodesulfovibrio mercurii]EGB15758.1 CheD [Pseudodesulfovibrio mercurii]
MNAAGPGLAKIFLQTGDCFIGVQPTLVTTVLGSCLAVTIHAPKMGIGTICHAFLPDSSISRHAQGAEPQICRFVDTALQNMLETMDKIGVPRRDLCIKMFGGGQGVAVNNVPSGSYNIGRRNIEMAKKLLKFARLDIQAQDVGGSEGRKLMFNTRTGDVWVKKLNKFQHALVGNGNARDTRF